MKTQIEKQITETKDFSKYHCDICQVEIKSDGGPDVDYADDNSSQIYYSFGSRWDSNGHNTEVKLDICVKCLKEKVQPLLENTFNVKFRETITDW